MVEANGCFYVRWCKPDALRACARMSNECGRYGARQVLLVLFCTISTVPNPTPSLVGHGLAQVVGLGGFGVCITCTGESEQPSVNRG